VNAHPVVLAAALASGDTLPIDGTTVLWLATAAVLMWLARSLAALRAEVAELKGNASRVARPPAPAAGPTPAEVAAIAAAVHVVLGAPARIVAVAPRETAALQVWSHEGRRDVFQSHQLR
jgi:hypothetical protein